MMTMTMKMDSSSFRQLRWGWSTKSWNFCFTIALIVVLSNTQGSTGFSLYRFSSSRSVIPQHRHRLIADEGTAAIGVATPVLSLASSSWTEPSVSSSSSSASTSATTTSTTTKSVESLWKYLQDCFQGDFDNYHQVVQDRQHGWLPREGGGHEHIHCTLLPLDVIGRPYARLAAFYFDGIPQRIFRFRYYELEPAVDAVLTKLYLLHPQLEVALRAEEDPLQWPRLFESFTITTTTTPTTTTTDDSKKTSLSSSSKTRLLTNCDVQWTGEKDAIQLEWQEDITTLEDYGIHATMLQGEALVDSTMTPGSKIRVLDQLSLWSNHFWIHDRGFDPNTGAFIYGNQAGVPYRLERVTHIQQGQRHVVKAELQWTLGPLWRTPLEYQTNMNRIGGVSTRINS